MDFDKYYLSKLKKEGKLGEETWLSYYLNSYENKPEYVSWYKRHVKKTADLIEKYFGDLTGKKILEIGSGRGMLAAELVRKGAFLTGIEVDKQLVNYSIERFKFGKLRGTFLQASADNLPFEDGSFDLVVSIDVLEHVKNPQKMLNEMSRVLKKGGGGYFSAANTLAFWTGHSHIRNRIRRGKGTKESDFEFLFSYPRLMMMCKKAGFSRYFLKYHNLTGIKGVFYSFFKKLGLVNFFMPSFTVIVFK